jgi:hypothetical protein
MTTNETTTIQYRDRFATVEIRPGVHFPDWAAVPDDTAADALAAILSAFNAGECQSAVGPEDDRVRQAVLRLFARLGRAPELSEIAEQTEIEAEHLRAILDRLNSQDLMALSDDGQVTGSYPITINQTDHRVRVGEQTLNAMCAIDALGVGVMYGRDVHIQSVCRNCGTQVRIETANEGRALKTVAPHGTRVWSGIRPSEGRAETTLCTVLAFFCGDACLETWRQANYPDSPGYRLTPDQALGVGRAIFGQTLVPAN